MARGRKSDDRQFNPKRILKQIGLVQLGYYGSLLLILALCSVLFGVTDVSLREILDYKVPSFVSAIGWTHICVFLLAAICASILLMAIVGKPKKCLDFGVTLYFVHFLLCSLYSGFPSTWDWWICMILCLAVTVVLGEYLSARREVDALPVFHILGSARSMPDSALEV